MPVPAIDFGVFIAYLLPGVIALYGLALVVPQLRTAVKADGQVGIGGALIVTLVALTLGGFLSLGRAVLVDATFASPLPFLNCASSAYLGGIPSVAPDYRQLFADGRRAAFLLAITNEQRPYQFCGNTALAMILLLGCWLSSLPKAILKRPRTALVATGAVMLMIALYAGARSSYYAYMRATAAVNGVDFNSFDRFNKPCLSFATLRQRN